MTSLQLLRWLIYELFISSYLPYFNVDFNVFHNTFLKFCITTVTPAFTVSPTLTVVAMFDVLTSEALLLT